MPIDDSWVGFAKNFGFPALLVILLLFGLAMFTLQVLKWAGPRLDQILDELVKYLRTTSKCMEELVDEVKESRKELEELKQLIMKEYANGFRSDKQRGT